MKFRNSLYKIVTDNVTEKDIAGFDVRIIKCHPILMAHFPSRPIVPGSCLLKILEELVGLYISKELAINSIRDVKFIKAITPDKTYHVGFTTIEASNGMLKVKGRVEADNDEIYSKFSILYDIKQ